MRSILNDRPLLYHHIEWVLMHPRFGILMLLLIGLSFIHNPMLALALFIFFSIEFGLRVVIMLNKIKVNPYRSSLNRKIDGLFLVLDFIGIASLLITVFNLPIEGQDAAAIRLLRAFYLLRTLRMFRYIDLQSAMYSPTYGMLISLVILLSFFAQDTLMWIIIIFFSVELMIRFVVMHSMKFESRRDKMMEWAYWWIDLVATIVMIPAFAVIQYGSALRMLRLVRLLRPWMVIVRNLRTVMREGQYMQEINLIVLLLGVMAIGGGVIGHFMLPDYDYDRNGIINDVDHTLLAPIWFAFRLFSDPGNTVLYPETSSIAVFSVLALVVGLFVLAFFIGIGASIVSGLMVRLRNERLNIGNHMLMLGWSSVAPYILNQLKIIAERSFTRLKLVILHNEDQTPAHLLEHNWATYRQGNIEETESLNRVNAAYARQAIVNIPDHGSAAEDLAFGMFSLIAIRTVNPDIFLTYAMPRMSTPRLDSHQHMLQIGWDTSDFYNKPTVVLSHADVRANVLRNILVYRDFDQVLERLMIPERTEESAMQICGWRGELQIINGRPCLSDEDGKISMNLMALSSLLFERGVILLALGDEAGVAHPLYALLEQQRPMRITSVIGIAINANALFAETLYAIRRLHDQPSAEIVELTGIHPVEMDEDLHLLVTGWVGSLPLLLKRLLDEFRHIHLTVLDDLTKEEAAGQIDYLQGRIQQLSGSGERIHLEYFPWDFTDMNALRPHVRGKNRILLSRPLKMKGQAYAGIATVLAHLVTIVREEDESPDIFPILEDRHQARLLQEELARFDLDLEIHVTVPEEFYGTYIAHTSYHMYHAENKESYELQRTLRHTLDDLMGDVGDADQLDLRPLAVDGPLPEDAASLYASLLKQGQILIGYRLRRGFEWSDPVQNVIRKLFPREEDFSCIRQHQIIINPFGNPVSRYSWTEYRDDIVELIVIGESFSS